MRWLALALLLVAVPAGAADVTKKIAVLYNTQVNFGISTPQQLAFEHLLMRMGIPYDRYDVSTRTWNTDHAVDDSVWFRQRYEAVLIPRFPRSANPGNFWHENFENSASVDGWYHSPLNGTWSIPVYAMAASGLVPEAWYDHGILTGDSLRLGIINVGSRTMSTAPESLGTWRDRSMSRLRGVDFPFDTLYARPTHMVVKSPLYHETVAALTWQDTTNAAVNFDTLMTTWRYRPLADKPGIVWTIFDGNIQATAAPITGPLILLELMFRETAIKPRKKLPLGVTIHDFIRRAPDATTDDLTDQMLDAIERAGIKAHWAMDLDPCIWGTYGSNTFAWPRLRAHLQNGFGDFHVHSHSLTACGGGDWSWNSTDSANVRLLYNRMLSAAARPDSFNLPMQTYKPYRTVPANSDMTANAAATAWRAGVRVIETGDYAQTVTVDGQVAPRWADAKAFSPPGISGVMFVRPIFEVSVFEKNLTTGVAVNSSGVLSLSIRQYVTGSMENALVNGGSVFWHFYRIAGNTDADQQSDPYCAWIIEKTMGTYIKTFSNVIQMDVPGHDPRQVGSGVFTEAR